MEDQPIKNLIEDAVRTLLKKFNEASPTEQAQMSKSINALAGSIAELSAGESNEGGLKALLAPHLANLEKEKQENKDV